MLMGVSTTKGEMVPVVRGVKWVRAFTVKWGMKEVPSTKPTTSVTF